MGRKNQDLMHTFIVETSNKRIERQLYLQNVELCAS